MQTQQAPQIPWGSRILHGVRAKARFVLLFGVAAALAIRLLLFHIETQDYYFYLNPWFATLRHTGFGAFRYSFSNYAPLYLYAMYLIAVLFPKVSAVYGLKTFSVMFDLICAILVARMVNLKYRRREYALLALLAVLSAPTIVLNSSYWGQADMVYTAVLIASLYLLMIGRQVPAFLAFGVALALKLQAVFLAPLLLILFLKRKVSWASFLLIPVVYLVTILPAWFAGRPLGDLLTIYLGQFDFYPYLTSNAPNLYQWLPFRESSTFTYAGIVAAAAIVCVFVFVVWKSQSEITPALTIHLALLSALIVPFLLPRMHERYFFPADVLSIVFAFYFPKFAFVSIEIQLGSLLSYYPYLFGREEFPISLVALGLLACIALLIQHLFITLYPQGIEIHLPALATRGGAATPNASRGHPLP